MNAIAVAATSYCMGSIPFSYIWAKVFGGIDIRQVGSMNVGTTNVICRPAFFQAFYLV